ncbi:MAG: type 1 glutamine amidotransferase [Bacteroidetes bacterium]|nr:type 1 glutamine amidotransferase [Bacteroidota bacterium]
MRIHILQHERFEGPGYIEVWAKENNHEITFTKFYEQVKLPGINDFDMLIIMGGPMGIYDEDKFPWLTSEKIFIKNVIDSGKLVLGICLGSQLIAASLGAKVYPNKFKEIGWFDIKLTENAKNNLLFTSFPQQTKVFQWHGDTFDLPEGALLLAESEACKNQAFVYKEKVFALQFHCEVTENSLQEMLEEGKNELKKEKYIQTAEEILSKKYLISDNNKMIQKLLEKMVNIR